ncbi:MAG: hypothetical protein V4501_08630 [Pseudomonadota bacterium]
MNISDQFKYIHNLIIKVVETGQPPFLMSMVAKDIKQHFVDGITAEYLSRFFASQLERTPGLYPIIVQIACEETRMNYADDLQRAGMSGITSSAILNSVSDISITHVLDFVKYVTHEVPHEHGKGSETAPHKLFIELTETEIKIINYYVNTDNMTVDKALDVLTDMSEEHFKFLSYYINNLKTPVNDALKILSNKKNKTTTNTLAPANTSTADNATTLSSEKLAALKYSKQLSETLNTEQVAEEYLQRRVVANTATTGTILQNAGFPQTAATLPEWSSTSVTAALTNNNALPLTWSASVAANFPSSIVAFSSLLIAGLVLTGSMIMCSRFFRAKSTRALEYANPPGNDNDDADNNVEPKKLR